MLGNVMSAEQVC